MRSASPLLFACLFFLSGLRAHAQQQTLPKPDQDRADVALAWAGVLGIIGEPNHFSLTGHSEALRSEFLDKVDKWSNEDGEAELPSFGEVRFDDLYSSGGERLARVPSIKIEAVQTSKYVYGVPYGAPAGTPADYLKNPDSSLLNYSATLNFAEAFLSIADRGTTCASAAALRKANVRINAVAQRNFCTSFVYLTGGRGIDLAQRLASGVSLTYTAAQNARFQSSLLQAGQAVSFSDSLTGSFDPTKTWRTASDWLAAIRVLPPNERDDLEGDGDPHSNVTKDYPCLSLTEKDGCFLRYAYGYRPPQFLQALLPRVDVKVVTPLNFQSAGNIFLSQQPDEHKRLYTVSATLDLSRFIPNSNTRSDAANVIAELAKARREKLKAQKLRARSAADQKVEEFVAKDWHGWRKEVALLYKALADNPDLVSNESWWETFQATVFKL